MDKFSLSNLSQNKYKKGAELGLMNAKNHLIVSLEAAKVKQYGIANSLLILGIEELAKASILKIKSIYNLMVIHNIDNYFTHHKPKHDAILKLFFASYELLEKEQNNQSNDTKNSDSTNSNIWIIGLLILILVGFASYLFNSKNGNENQSNLDDEKDNTKKNKYEKSHLDSIKESGFYLGFDKKDGSWLYPNQIHQPQNYKQLKEVVDLAIGTIESTLFSGKITKENIIQYADKLKDKNIFPKRIKNFKKNIS